MRSAAKRTGWFIVTLLLTWTVAACSSSNEGSTAQPTHSDHEASAAPSLPSYSVSPSPESPSATPLPSSSASASPSKDPQPSKDDSGGHGGSGKHEDDDDDDHSPTASEKPSASPKPPKASVSVAPTATPSPSPSASGSVEQGTVTVEIKDFAFSPSEITVARGGKVKFINRDDVKHSAVADSGAFDTGMLGLGESNTVTIDDEGTFTYYCNPHTGMTGKITVTSS